MKIKPEHFAHIRDAIAPHADELREYKGTLASDPRVKDVDKRLRWDASYAYVKSAWICDNLYPYMDDSHVDTALRAVMRELNL